MARGRSLLSHPSFVGVWTLSLVTAIAVVDVAGAQDGPSADPDPKRFADELAAFRSWDAKNASPLNPVLFVGSSSIRLWSTATDFPNPPVINRGFGGAHLSDLIHYADATILRYNPKIVVVYAGDNDIADGKAPDRILRDFENLVSIIRSRDGDVGIAFIAIKPSLDRWAMWPEMTTANKMIRAFCDAGARLFFVDVASRMLGDNGQPVPSLFVEDGLHLSEEGYDLWAQLLRRTLDQM